MTGIVAAVVVGLAVCQVAIFLTTIYLHRTVSHRAITMRPWLAFACRLLLWLTTGIKPRQWAAVHRKHHAFVDEQGDPHSPILEGFWQVQLGNVLLYRKAAADRAAVDKYARDLVPDRYDRVFDHGLIGLAVGIGLLFLPFWGDWRLVAIAAAVHVVTYLLLNSAVNAIGHTFGKRPYNGLAANSQWLAWLTAGEGLHSNHHAAPTSARLSFARRELDPGWWCIAFARRMRWLTVRHESPKVAARARRSPATSAA
ncbi:MAG TPA: fatty acid desaturase [Acidimicrobiales bacterium]|nr:fatty acid desaturase [Acidimicrobiales bacterium]